jgi:hypothetical protein
MKKWKQIDGKSDLSAKITYLSRTPELGSHSALYSSINISTLKHDERSVPSQLQGHPLHCGGALLQQQLKIHNRGILLQQQLQIHNRDILLQ